MLRARVAELADEELGVDLLRLVDAVEHRADLVDRLVLVPADLELDESRTPALRDLAAVGRIERRPHMLNGFEPGDPGDDVRDRGLEGGIARANRVALDQDAFPGGLLEPSVEDPVHAAGLARACRVRIDGLRPDRATDCKRNDDEPQPAERGDLPVSGAPAAHPGREVEMRLLGA